MFDKYGLRLIYQMLLLLYETNYKVVTLILTLSRNLIRFVKMFWTPALNL